MTIADTDKIDFLWKKLIYGVDKTASGTAKTGSNETIASPLPVYNANIWTQTDTVSIPATPPTSSTSVISVLTGSNRIRMTNNATSAVNTSWLATTTYGTASTTIGSFIPASFGSNYSAHVWIGDPAVGPAARIFPDTTGEEWVFDYNAGSLFFPNAVPTAKTATVGSGTVTVASAGIYIEVYQYIGVKGITVPATTSGTASVTFGPSSSSPFAVATVPAGARVVEITLNVTTAFDGSETVTVGTSAAPDLVLGAADTDLSSTGTYVANAPGVLNTTAGTALIGTLSGAATVGSATLTISFV